jgi:hypothetical protein
MTDLVSDREMDALEFAILRTEIGLLLFELAPLIAELKKDGRDASW